MKFDDLTCETCGAKFPFYCVKGQSIPRFCSHKCRGHTGFRPGGQIFISEMTEEQKFERLKKSFEKHVIRQDGCWSWKGPIAKGGYPVMSCRREIGSDKGHRASWIIHKGPIPKHKHICHKCDNPICTNPDHLWLGSMKENNDDKIQKGRANYKKPPLKKGEENGSAKLTNIQVKEIKELLKTEMTNVEIGQKYGVSKTSIWRIRHGKKWKDIEV